jgi:uncharacterized protein (DUF1786 family)
VARVDTADRRYRFYCHSKELITVARGALDYSSLEFPASFTEVRAVWNHHQHAVSTSRRSSMSLRS